MLVGNTRVELQNLRLCRCGSRHLRTPIRVSRARVSSATVEPRPQLHWHRYPRAEVEGFPESVEAEIETGGGHI